MDWDLTRLYADFDDKFDADLDKAAELAKSGLQFMRGLKAGENDVENMKEAIVRKQELSTLFSRAAQFTHLTISVNATHEAALRAQDRIAKISNTLAMMNSAFTDFVGKIADLDSVIEADPLIKEHEFILRETKAEASHLIDPELEPLVLQMQTTGAKAWANLRGTLDATLLIDVDEERKGLSLAAVRGFAYSADADLRKRAYEAEIAAYPRTEIAMAACLNGIKGEAITLLPYKKYSTPIEMTLDSSRMDQETLDALIAVLYEALPMFRRYFRAKAKALGYEGGLKFYDLFAPLGASGKTFTLEEAREYLVKVLSQFSDNMGKFIDNAFEERWIDAFPKPGKRGGAFCSGAHCIGRSYVCTNFDGSLSSVSTLAHELGHAYHGSQLMKNSPLNTGYPMPLAETASIFNETLLSHVALKNCTSADEELMLLDTELTDASQVVVDILSRYIFETEVFARRADHNLSVKELKEIMLDAQRKTYGDGLDENCMHPYMWACKPHYYRHNLHFYNFPYAFGLLFGKGVFAQYEKEGDAFIPKYDELLANTVKGNVYDVAKSVGIDVHDINFWRSSIEVISKTVDRFCELVG